ncbi:MAG: UTP--glucose-1-phosphate uridylyltransferase [Oscillospiraceae bacterium]|nr:UTP--glucose-1-phosphate uridylyltransferase [Oscillospiraceae bacterium]
MDKKLKFAQEQVSIYKQEQLLRFYNELDEKQKSDLLNQIASIDFDYMKKLYNQTQIKNELKTMKIDSVDYIDKYNLPSEKLNEYKKIGTEAISSGKLAVITMAGGQGTRLGHSGPKGTFDIGLDSGKSIFEILCDKFKEVQEKYGITMPWYIMTSKANNYETVDFFERNSYFNYPKNKINFFIQNEIPALDFNGKILLEEKAKISEAPNGDGGIFNALHKFNVIQDIKNQNIEWVFIGGVDNILAQIADPILIGAAIVENKEIACKTVEKAYEQEKVGVFCKKNGKIGIIEYTERTDEIASKRDKDGKFLYGDTNILCNLFNIKVLEKAKEVKLPQHTVIKKINYVDEFGKKIYPEEPNAYKFENFFFDVFEMIDDIILVRGKREEEFAPIKNAKGVDSPETAKKLYMDYFLNRLA